MTSRSLLPFLAAALLTVAACGGERIQLSIKARMNGQPAAQAKVTVDGVQEGVTDHAGVFVKVLERKAGTLVKVEVSKEQAGHRVTPWTVSFEVDRVRQSGGRHAVEAELTAVPYVVVAAAENGAPVAGAAVSLGGKSAGTTDAKGEYVLELAEARKDGPMIGVAKAGYASWSRTGPVEPGMRIEAALSREVLLKVLALVDEYGQSAGIAGASISIDGKQAGRTDAGGELVYRHVGKPGRTVSVTISAPGHLPDSWKGTATLDGSPVVQRTFVPLSPRPLRLSLYRFVGNTPGTDLKEVLHQAETAVSTGLFKHACFKEVPARTVQAELKNLRLSIEQAVTKGWNDTPLRRTVDMIVLGSVARDDKGFLVEIKFYTAGGKVLFSQIVRAKDASGITGASRDLVAAVIEKFPFEGTVTAVDGDRYRINLGKVPYRISRGTEFAVKSPKVDDRGRIASYRETGRLKVKKSEDGGSWAQVDELAKDEKVRPGDRVVRRPAWDEDTEKERTFAVLKVKGGVPPDVSPLGGVNIYLNGEWIAVTESNGTAEVRVRPGRKYDLVLYRHGYQQLTGTLHAEKDRDVKEFSLRVNTSVFKVDSQPQGAEVQVDGERIGRTPLADGRPVTLGFHTVRLSLAGDYRDWEEVLEFASKVHDMTGARKIVLHKDYLKQGERAERKSDLDGAIAAYRSAEKGHPDYSEARHRLAQLYLDEKGDYDAAIREFENVLTLPENQQLVQKQFAVAFTNLGHAYYERGNALVQSDREGAAQAFARSVKNLQTAKQNTRFFPAEKYDEALHDTYYYTALSYHKLYLLTRKGSVLASANLAWREYFDFFPRSLEGKAEFDQSRETAQQYWSQIRDRM